MSEFALIGAVNDPAVGREDWPELIAQHLVRSLGPARTMNEGVEFDERDVKPSRELSRESCLPVPARAGGHGEPL